MPKKLRKTIKNYAYMGVGSLLYSLSLALLLDPNNLAPGGVSGIAIILNRFVPIQVGTLILLMNIPIMIMGFVWLGKQFCFRSFLCLVVTSFLINEFSVMFQPIVDDKILAALWGGGMMGLGIGLVMKQNASTGGMDVVVKLLRKRFPELKTSALYLVLDASVVVAASICFRNVSLAMYAGICIYFSSHLLDLVLYGKDEANLVYIISDKNEEIAESFLEDLDIGVTYIEGKGGYSKDEKQVIMAVMKKHVSAKAEEVIKEIDPKAFMIVTSATEIFGEGYKNILKEKL